MFFSRPQFRTFDQLLTACAPLTLMGVLLLGHTVSPTPTAASGPTTTALLLCSAEATPADDGAAPATLTAAGQTRAQALAGLLAHRPVSAVFTAPTAVCRATAAPLTHALHLQPQPYNAAEPAAMAARLERQYAGRTVVVVTEASALLPLLDALGAPRPVQQVQTTDTDLLLEVKLSSVGFPMVLTRRYGATR